LWARKNNHSGQVLLKNLEEKIMMLRTEKGQLSRRDWLQSMCLGFALTRVTRIEAAESVSFPATIAVEVKRAFSTPGPQPNGLQATQDGLWVLDQGTNRVALLDYRDGKVIREFGTVTDRGSGITFDGSTLWIASTYNRLILRVDPQNGKTLMQFPSPGSGVVKWGPRSEHPSPTGAHGLEFSLNELWVAVPPSAAIYVMNPENGGVLRSFPAPGIRPHGIGWDPDGALWCTESNYRSFFKMSRQDGKILKQVLLPPTLPEVDGIVVVPHGMTIWDNQIWFCVAETAEVYRFRIPK
jgi:DNA-binding beta-propeller fold protein YncE